jgi:AraC family transcriptional regulator
MLNWPLQTDLQVSRRTNRPGPVVLVPQPFHRLSMHMSTLTVTTCRETGMRFTRSRGDIDVIPALSQGGFDSHESSASLDVSIPPSALQRLAEEADIPLSRVSLGTEHMVRDPALQHLVLALSEPGSDNCPLYWESLSVALALRLLSRSPMAVAQAQGARCGGALVRVTDYIEDHLDGQLTLELLSKVAGMSRSSLHRAFKNAKGVALHRYVMLRRVERARSLIVRGRVPHSEAAMLSGFADQSHMARWVRRVLGSAPGELAREGGHV